MSCYQPLLGHIQDMDHKKRSTVSLFNVILTIIGFFVLFFFLSKFVGKHSDSFSTEDFEHYKSSRFIVGASAEEETAQNFKNNESDEMIITTEEPITETAATLYPAKTTTFDPSISENNAENSKTQKLCGKRIVGYYNGWDNQKLSEQQFQKITHLIFAFIKMNQNGTISFENEEKKQLFLETKKKAKDVNPAIKVMFSIGGLYNSEHFSKVATHSKKREIFINSIVSFIEEYQFDGVDIFWKWPEQKDKAHYVFLVRELQKKLEKLTEQSSEKLFISIVSPSVGFELMEGFHLNGLLKYVDFVNVETDKFNGKNNEMGGAFTGALSPLFSEIGQYKEFNVDWTMRHLTCTTGKPSQFNMGVPFYGRYWKNVQEPVEKADEMWRTVQETKNGKVASGIVFYKNIEKEGWNKESISWHEESKTPFIWDSNNRMFLGFENEKSLKEKMKYTIDKNLGGLTIWTLEMDDDVDSLLEAVTSSSDDMCSSGDELNSVRYQCDN